MLSIVLLNRTLRNLCRWNSLIPNFTIHEDTKLSVCWRTFNTTGHCLESRRDVNKQSPLSATKGYPSTVEQTDLNRARLSKDEDKTDITNQLGTNEELRNRTEELKRRIEELERKEQELEKQSKELKSPPKPKKRARSSKGKAKLSSESWFDKLFRKKKKNKTSKSKGKVTDVMKTKVNKQQEEPKNQMDELKLDEMKLDAEGNKNEEDNKISEVKKSRREPVNETKDLKSSPPTEEKTSGHKVDPELAKYNFYPWPFNLFLESNQTNKERLMTSKIPMRERSVPRRRREDMTKRREDMMTAAQRQKPSGRVKKSAKRQAPLPWPFSMIEKKVAKKVKQGVKTKGTKIKNKVKANAFHTETAGRGDGMNLVGAVNLNLLSRLEESSEIPRGNQTEVSKGGSGRQETILSRIQTQLSKLEEFNGKKELAQGSKYKLPCDKRGKRKGEDKKPKARKAVTKIKKSKDETHKPKARKICEEPEDDCRKNKEVCIKKNCKDNQMLGVSDRMREILVKNIKYFNLTKRCSHTSEECPPAVHRTPYDTSCIEVSSEVEKEMADRRKVARFNRRRICEAIVDACCNRFRMTRSQEKRSKLKANITGQRYVRRYLRKSKNPDSMSVELCASCH